MVRILGLQGTYQSVKFRETSQILQANVFQKKWPARKSVIDSTFKPFKSHVASVQQRKDASDLIVGVVGVPEGFCATAGASHACQCLFRLPQLGRVDTQQADDQRIFG